MENRPIPQFLIAAPTSGSGKTTLCRGLMALLTQKGSRVQPYKCGPDYIDTKFHTALCGRPSINLDTFMASAPHVRELYSSHAVDADVCIVEGMMGMYDGYDRSKGSSAAIAELLRLPVVLVVDAKSVAYSVAPLLYGFSHFPGGVKIAGVIFNRVGSARHYEMLKEVCDEQGITCFGYLPKDKNLVQEERYLGLDFSKRQDTAALDALVALVEEHIDYPLLLEKTMLPMPLSEISVDGETVAPSDGTPPATKKLKILVARSPESFCFIYEEHLEILHRLGEVRFFNPQHNRMPSLKKVDLLYLPGGYPEKHYEALGEAWDTHSAIREYARNGGRILAECGGMIYLSSGLVYKMGEIEVKKPLVKLLPFTICNDKKKRRLSLGYRQFELGGQQVRGHEFHYTQIETMYKQVPTITSPVYDGKGRPVDIPVFRYLNVIASYIHLYWGEIDIMKLFNE